MSISSGSTHSLTTPDPPGISTRRFSNEPLLLRLDMATHAFYKTLENSNDKKLMEIISRAANVNVTLRLASKKEFKNYKQPGHEENTRNVCIKYRTREENLLHSGTFDPVWGLKWLLSFVILVDWPVFNTTDVLRLCELIELWLGALAEADIHEVTDFVPELNGILETARGELVCLRALCEKLPGQFNSACSLLFGGALKQVYVEPHMPKWVVALNSQCSASNVGQPGNANVDSSSALAGSNAPMSIAEAQECVSRAVPLEGACRNCGSYDLLVKSIGTTAHEDSDLVPVQMSVFNRQLMQEEGEQLDLLFERDVVADMCVGFVIEATLYQLGNSQHFIDSVTMVWPSYTPLDYLELY